MKKLFFLLITILLLASCDDNQYKVNPTKDTTIELQQLTKDTIIVSQQGNYLYQFDDNNLVSYRYIIEQQDGFQISIGTYILLILLVFIVGIYLGLSLIN